METGRKGRQRAGLSRLQSMKTRGEGGASTSSGMYMVDDPTCLASTSGPPPAAREVGLESGGIDIGRASVTEYGPGCGRRVYHRDWTTH